MKLREKRKAKREARRNDYDKEEERLRKMIADLDPLDENYDKMQQKLKNNIQMRADSKESKRRVCKSDRGGIIKGIVSVIGGLAGGLMIAKFERDSMTFTGEKRTFMDAITRTFGNMFSLGKH